MNSNQGVQPRESSYILTSAFRACKKKVLKKNFGNDKVSNDEKESFANCIVKYISLSETSYEGLRAGFLEGAPTD